MGRLQVYEERTGRYLDVFKKHVKNVEVVADIGCGVGSFSKALADEKRLLIALDIQREFLKGLKGLVIERICADAHCIPFRENSVDCVLSFSLMEHLRKPNKHVEELHRILKCGGIVILQLPNLQYLFEPHSKWPLLCFLPESLQSKIFKKIDYSYVNMRVTIKYASTLFQKIGFNLKERIKVYHLSIMKLLPIAPSYFFVAEKVCSRARF